MVTEDDKKEAMICNFAVLLINEEDFGLLTKMNEEHEKVFVLYDFQSGNLGNIEQKEFLDLADIIDSLDIYHEDYIYRSLTEREEANEKIDIDDFDFVASKFLENDKITEVLETINVDKYFNLTKVSHELDFSNSDCISYVSELLNEDKNKEKTEIEM